MVSRLWYTQTTHKMRKLADVPARLGFVIFAADASIRPIGMSLDISDDILDRFQVRQTQIDACEALAGVVVPHNVPSFLQGHDIIWYIDNQSACQLLVKGASSVADLSILAAVKQLMFPCLGCRLYFEYVESDANLKGPYTLRQTMNPYMVYEP